MQLSNAQIFFPEFISAFWKGRPYFGNFEKYDDHQSLCISKITDCKSRG